MKETFGRATQHPQNTANVMRLRYQQFFRACLVLAATLLLASCAGTRFHHDYVMRGQVVSVNGSDALICIGNAKDISIGQILMAYRIVYKNDGEVSAIYDAVNYDMVQMGHVTIDAIVKEHFVKATIMNGDIKQYDMMQLQ